MLVEVKNFHKRGAGAIQSFSRNYVTKLRNYHSTFRRSLYIATFWSRWRQWALVPLDKIPDRGTHYGLSMSEALKASEMRLLGDHMIATTPPLVFRLLTDPVEVSFGQQQVNARIRDIEIYCGGNRVEDEFEKNLVMYRFVIFPAGTAPEKPE